MKTFVEVMPVYSAVQFTGTTGSIDDMCDLRDGVAGYQITKAEGKTTAEVTFASPIGPMTFSLNRSDWIVMDENSNLSVMTNEQVNLKFRERK